jgi:DNA polymerase-3 subunit alpha
MLLSQKLADFTKGEADTLRKAMGKKDRKVLDKMRPVFIERGNAKGHANDKLEKIWKDWEAFASYAFNKSHSTCYAWVAYQTAYLKANYPAEYMAAVLSNNMSDIKQVTFFMEECRRMGVNVLGPDVNESRLNFTVNANGDIRFGLGAIRGIGEGPVEAIIQGRSEGRYTSIFDFIRRVNLKAINRAAMQNLVYAGGFDSFSELHRAQYFIEEGSNRLFLENIIRYGNSYQESKDSNQQDLFGKGSGFDVVEPKIPSCEEWSSSYKLAKEREVIGIFISGHPLDDYKMEIDAFCTGALAMLHDMETYKGRDLLMAVVVTSIEHRIAKNGDPFGTVIFEDYTDQYKLNIFRENYLKFKHLLQPGVFLTLRGRIETPRHRTHLEFNLNEVELLQHLREKRVKGLHLSIPNKDLNHLLIDELNGLFLANQGSCNVQFTIFDAVEGLELNMASKSVRVKPDPELYKALSKMNIQFRLN